MSRFDRPAATSRTYITYGFHLEELTDGPRQYDRERFKSLRARNGFANLIMMSRHGASRAGPSHNATRDRSKMDG